jgi:hypothetical protein
VMIVFVQSDINIQLFVLVVNLLDKDYVL